MIKYFRVGKITKQQGIKGEAKINPTSSDKKRYDYLKKVYLINNDDNDEDLSNEKIFYVENVKYLNDGVIIKFKDINTIEDIVKYIGYSLYVDREDAIKLSDNEYYISDLFNMNVKDNDNKLNGTVIDVLESKSASTLVIKTDKKNVLIPFVKDYIQKVDFSTNTIHVNLIEGILDL